jgi:hypothetical protein
LGAGLPDLAVTKYFHPSLISVAGSYLIANISAPGGYRCESRSVTAAFQVPAQRLFNALECSDLLLAGFFLLNPGLTQLKHC